MNRIPNFSPANCPTSSFTSLPVLLLVPEAANLPTIPFSSLSYRAKGVTLEPTIIPSSPKGANNESNNDNL